MSDNSNNEQQHKEQPIIIKKIKKGGHGHHGGAWKVAYADFVTAMMAFFIVMWILGQSEEVKQNVADYFNDPMSYSVFTGKKKTDVPVQINIFEGSLNKSGESDQSANGEGSLDGDQKPVIINFSTGEQQINDSTLNKELSQAIQDSIRAAKRVKELGDFLNKEFENMMTQKPDMEEILSSIKIEISKEGTRIELIETSESLFFKVGSNELKTEAVDILKLIASELGKYPNNIEIEGHTDSRAYRGTNYTNWELSTDRANSARKVLEKNGLWEDQVIKVTGFADNKLRKPENPFDITNRRVSILVKQLSATELLRGMQENQDFEQ
jgi:chemotaxis protein MotB